MSGNRADPRIRRKPASASAVRNRPNSVLLLRQSLEIEVVVVATARVERRIADWALIPTLQILIDSQFRSAASAQYCLMVPLAAPPDFNRVAS